MRVKTNHAIDGTTADGLEPVYPAGHRQRRRWQRLQLSAYADMEIYDDISGGTATLPRRRWSAVQGQDLDVDLETAATWVGHRRPHHDGLAGRGRRHHDVRLDEQLRVRYGSTPSDDNDFGGTPSSPSSSGAASASNCTVESASSGTSQFDGLWLRVRAHIARPTRAPTHVERSPVLVEDRLRVHQRGWQGVGDRQPAWPVNVEGDPIRLTQ